MSWGGDNLHTQKQKGGIPIDNQTKKAQLQRYRNCEREITRIEEEIQRWESRAEMITAAYHNLSQPVDGVADLKAIFYTKLVELVEARKEIEKTIQSVSDGQIRLLLEYRYIDGLNFAEIADRMHYSWRHINNLHNKALEEIIV